MNFKKPTFIDKPFTTTVADAQAIINLAAKAGVPIMNASSLRYVDNFPAALTGDADQGQIHRTKVARQIDVTAAKRPPTVCMLETILRTLQAGTSDVPVAANQSRTTGQASLSRRECLRQFSVKVSCLFRLAHRLQSSL